LNYLNKLQDAAFEYSFPKEYQESLHRFGLNDYDEKLKKSLDVLLDFQLLLEMGDFPKKVENQEEWGGANLVITGEETRRNQLNRDYPVNTSKTDPLPPAQCDPLKILLTLG
jgi:hypothetical protein